MSDLKIVFDEFEGLRAVAGDAFMGWTLGEVRWLETGFGETALDEPVLLATGVFDVSAYPGGVFYQVEADATAFDGTQQTLRTGIVFSAQGGGEGINLQRTFSQAAESVTPIVFGNTEEIATYLEYPFSGQEAPIRVYRADGSSAE